MSSHDYRAGPFRFRAPKDLEDKSAFTFLAREGDVVRFNLTVMREPAPNDLEAYLKLAVEEMRAALSGYSLKARSTLEAPLTGALLSHSAISPDGDELIQRQAFIARDDELLVITGSAMKAAEDDMVTRFDALLASVGT